MGSMLIMHNEQIKEVEKERQLYLESERGPDRAKTRSTKLSTSKKGKRFCPYGAQASKTAFSDPLQLVDIPVTEDKSTQWALVASPNKPPEQK